jgi:hypothetical protein
MMNSGKIMSRLLPQLLGLVIFLGGFTISGAQEPMVGGQNGITWRNLTVGGTPAEALSRKTFYVDGLDNMSAFWSKHADLKADAVDYNAVFLGMNVGQIRDGLDSFYVDEKNVQVPIVDAILVIRLHNAHVEELEVNNILAELREATVNGPDPVREKKIWQEGLKLIK